MAYIYEEQMLIFFSPHNTARKKCIGHFSIGGKKYLTIADEKFDDLRSTLNFL